MNNFLKFANTLLLLIFISQFAFGQSSNTNKPLCAKFKTGTFELKDKTTNVHTLIKRTKKHQIEYDQNKKGAYIKFKLTWLSDCEYTLKVIKAKKADDVLKFFIDKTLHVVITETEGDEYTFQCRFKELPDFPMGTLKIKKLK